MNTAADPSPVTETTPRLSAEGVRVTFGGLRALDDVSLVVPAGATIGLVGPNGAGKTTLFGVLSGLQHPAAGRVLIDGADVTRASPQSRARRGLARTFQRLELFGELTVREHFVVAYRVRARRARFITDILGLGRRPSAEEQETVEALLALLDLEPVGDVPAGALPLGTGRLVEVGRALAREPTVVLLDEPSAGLDEHETDRLAAALRRAREERGVALVVVEHNVELVLGLSERVTVLDFGRVIAEGRPADIRANADVQAAYLGAPMGAL
ncbi:MAG: ABC transporter ATP-binding protein [Acidimicrobiia bacterium]